ncbi:hypothetical protein QUA56_25410 [Microcoleus sp. N3A4]
MRSIASADLMELRLLRADMNLLMTISVIGAVILGDWFEAALAVAVIADTGTSLIVTASGMRLFRSKLN